MRQWFVATTKHQHEYRAAAELRALGYVVYLPKTYVRGKLGEFRPALRCPGYILIEFDAALGEHGPLSTARTLGELFIDRDGNPRPMRWLPPLGIVEALREIEDIDHATASASRKPKPREDLQKGDEVMIDNRDHPENGEKGFILKIERNIAFVLLGSWMTWEIPDSDLRKVDRPMKMGRAA